MPSNNPVLPESGSRSPLDCSFENTLCLWRVVGDDPAASSEAEASDRAGDWRVAGRRFNFGAVKDHTFGVDRRE